MRKVIARLFARLYILSLLVIVLWCSWSAFAYLYRSVFVPATAPPDYVNHRLIADAEMLSTRLPGENKGDIPPGHYHRIVATPVVASPSGCQTSGCHPILPHQRDPVMRSFANLHVTFLDCLACHNGAAPSGHAWVTPEDGTPVDPPAVLQLITVLEASGDNGLSAADASRVTNLVKSVLDLVNEPSLTRLYVDLTTADPDSPVHRHAVAELRILLPRLARGDYRALLVPRDRLVDGAYTAMLSDSDVQAALQLRAGDPGYTEIMGRLHDGVNGSPNGCLVCHAADGARFDFQSAGYPAHRAAALRDLGLARMIEYIRHSKPFYLPGMLEAGDGD